ncbi:oligogalacturonate lyase family protein [Kribbella sp. NPDC004536]|uniref:oligogalacturonate lyase family protein n=1 Tax=Kribbella sp. NPDC004536 TaxID=3364106 RepID=UPI0036C74525
MIVAQGAHLTYPHANGFHDDRVAVVRWDAERSATALVSVSLDDAGDVQEICTVPGPYPNDNTVWFDVARSARRLAAVWDDALHLVDLDDPVAEVVYRGRNLHGLVSINAAGDRVLVAEQEPCRLLEVDVDTGGVRVVHTSSWWSNHAHYCPADEAWIGFSHEGPTETVPDRVWAWHASELPAGGCVLKQPDGLYFGHERWAHHAVGAVVVAYGVSPGEPRGLYWTSPGEPEGRLLSRGDRYWHCDINRDGTLAVVDTSGPADRPGKGWENADNQSDVLLIDLRDGQVTPLARTLAKRHPAHPHPIFTPDSSSVLYNHLAPDGTVSVGRVNL